MTVMMAMIIIMMIILILISIPIVVIVVAVMMIDDGDINNMNHNDSNLKNSIVTIRCNLAPLQSSPLFFFLIFFQLHGLCHFISYIFEIKTNLSSVKLTVSAIQFSLRHAYVTSRKSRLSALEPKSLCMRSYPFHSHSRILRFFAFEMEQTLREQCTYLFIYFSPLPSL